MLVSKDNVDLFIQYFCSCLKLSMLTFFMQYRRKPVMPNTYAVLKAKFVETEDRKIFLSATLHDSGGVLLADCTALFVKLR